MTLQPSSVDSIYTELKTKISRKIPKITNFSSTSFNAIWLRNAFSNYLREMELSALAIQLSGWVDYAGKELTQEDLDALGVEDVDPDEINKYMKAEHLDAIGQTVGVSRAGGQKAEGELLITTTSDTVTIPEGTEFGTVPNVDGSFYAFQTLERASPESGTKEVFVPSEAVSVGSASNVGSGTVTYMPNPLTGISEVTNPEVMAGGVDRQSTEELRGSIKNAIFENSGGGTVKGIEGYIRSNIDGVNSVSVEEFPASSPPYVDVIVEGGLDDEVLDAIEFSRPVAILHNLVRPTDYTVNVHAAVSGGNIDTSAVDNAIVGYLNTLPLGGDVIRDKLVQAIMNADSDIEKIDNIHVEVSGESHTYTDSSIYTLDKGESLAEDGIVAVTGILNGSSHDFIEDVDYEEADSGSGSQDAIDWGLGGDVPDTETEFTVTYRIDDDLPIAAREKCTAGNITVQD